MTDPGFRLLVNARSGVPGVVVLPEGGWRRARAAITAWPGYAPTPLRPLEEVAAALGLGAVHLKDESRASGWDRSRRSAGRTRWPGRSGGSWPARAANAASAAELESGRYAAGDRRDHRDLRDGRHHGRSVAWGARRFGARCVIFVHPGVSGGRRDAMAALGAEVREVPGTYDESVRASDAAAREAGWLLVSDTAWPGYTEVPREVMQGYRLMAEEALDATPAPPTHVFVPGGVGGAAAAVSVALRARYGAAPSRRPRLVVVEPERAACLLASAEAGAPTAVAGELDTIMAGLACGEPSLLAWQELERAAFAFLAIPDTAAVAAMRHLARRDPPVEQGESGAAALAGLALAARDPAARAALGLGPESRALAFGTEGATDRRVYERLVTDGSVDTGAVPPLLG